MYVCMYVGMYVGMYGMMVFPWYVHLIDTVPGKYYRNIIKIFFNASMTRKITQIIIEFE